MQNTTQFRAFCREILKSSAIATAALAAPRSSKIRPSPGSDLSKSASSARGRARALPGQP